MNKKSLSLYSSITLSIFVVVLAIGAGVKAFNNSANTVMENVNIQAYNVIGEEGSEVLGAIAGPNVYQDMVFHGAVNMKNAVKTVAQTGAVSDVTLTSAESGSTVFLSATGTSIILPAVANTGDFFRFQVNGAMGIANMIIESAEGSNISGSLIVAGDLVSCSDEDKMTFVVDGEDIGDFFEVTSDGSNWLIGASSVKTASKLTCS